MCATRASGVMQQEKKTSGEERTRRKKAWTSKLYTMIMILIYIFHHLFNKEVRFMHALPRSRLYPCLLVAVFDTHAATAQEVIKEPARTLDTVVVRASADASAQGLSPEQAGGQVAKGARAGILGTQDAMSTPFSTTSYTQQYIQDQQARSVSDVLQADPSVRMAHGYGNFQELYMVRGFALYSDDVSYNGLYGLLPRQFVAAELFERVEVFRGANAFINGATPGGSGAGGAINLLPKRAPNEPLNRVTTGFDSGGQAILSADVARRFGTDQSQGLRLNVVRRQGSTGIDNSDRDLSMASVGWDLRQERLRLSADFGFQDHRLKGSRPNVTLASGVDVPGAPDSSDNYAQKWTYSNESTNFGTLRGEYDLGDKTTAWLALGARHSTEDATLANPTVIDNQGTTSAYRYDYAREDSVSTGEVGVRTQVSTGPVEHRINAAATRYQLESRNAYAFSNFSGFSGSLYASTDTVMPDATYYQGGDLGNPHVTEKVSTSSLAVSDTLVFGAERTLLTLGLRRQHIADYGYSYTTGDLTSAYSRSRTTPVGAVVFKIDPRFSLYANYIEALAKGAVASGSGITNAGEVFDPYVSRQKEIGLKYDGGSLGATLSAFTTSQPSGYVDGTVYTVSGKQRNRGVELNTFGQVNDRLRLLGGITLMEGKQIETSGGATDGKNAIGVPHVTSNMGADWDVPWVSRLSVSGRVVYTGAQYVDAANTQRLQAWTRYDAGLRYLSDIGNTLVTWRANIENLTNRNYWASAGGYPGQGYLVQGAPRTLTVSATMDF